MNFKQQIDSLLKRLYVYAGQRIDSRVKAAYERFKAYLNKDMTP